MKTKKKIKSSVLSVFICVYLWSTVFLFTGCKTKPKPTTEPLQPTPVMVPPGNRPTSRPATQNAKNRRKFGTGSPPWQEVSPWFPVVSFVRLRVTQKVRRGR